MKYIYDNMLVPGETVLEIAKIHPIVFFWSGFGTILGLGFLFEQPMLGWVILGCTAFELFRMSMYYFGTEMVLTDKRLIAKFGFFEIRTMEIRLERIESINILQTVYGRFFNYGTFVANSITGMYVQVPMVMAPFEYRRKVVALLQKLQLTQPIVFGQMIPPTQPVQGNQNPTS